MARQLAAEGIGYTMADNAFVLIDDWQSAQDLADAVECARRDTLYTATAGGMGPATIAALHQLLQVLATDRAGILIAATDADTTGRRHAARLHEMATEAGVRFETIQPSEGRNDWNDALRAMAPAP